MRVAYLLSLLLILPGLAAADIYRWVDDDGVVHYGDRPPRNAERVEELPPLQHMQSVVIPEEEAEPASETAAAGAPQAHLEQPRPEQTFRDPRGRVPAAVKLSAPLAPDQRLVYYLDGRAVAEPTRNQQMRLEGVSRGEHRLSVAVTAGGEEVAHSQAVTFYMHSPSNLSPTGAPEGSAPGAPASGSAHGAPGAPRPGAGSGNP